MLNVSSGIGLSLVKELVELHHATIRVVSQPGTGSEFKIAFLLGNAHFKNDKQIEFILSDEIHYTNDGNFDSKDSIASDGNKGSNEKWSILIVEDNYELRKFLNDILSREYLVFEAENGKDGLDMAMSKMPDIIVSDVMMPVKDGLEMVREIKDNRDLCHIPIILLTAKASLDDRIKGLEKGIDDYITKPFSASFLRTRIQNLLRQRKTLQELYRTSLTAGNRSLINESLEPAQPHIMSGDEIFIQKLMDFMESNMDNPSLSVDDFVDSFSMSRAVFFKKMKMLLGISPVNFIQDIRIKRAIQLMKSGLNSVADIAYRCGFSDPNYFAKCFKKQIGISPSEYKSKKY